MSFKIKIKNIGKLTDAEIHIGRFTVFAGPNNTGKGKSTVSKLLYSLFDAMNANHAEIHISNLVEPVIRDFYRLGRWMRHDVRNLQLSPLEGEIEKLETLVKDCSIGDSEELGKIIQNLINQTNEIQERVAEIRLPNKRVRKDKEMDDNITFRVERMKESLAELKKSLAKLKERLSLIGFEECIVAGMEYKIRQNLIQNFQIPKLSDLRGEEDVLSELSVEDFGKFEFSNGEIEFEVDHIWWQELQHYSNVIYLESPVYWKLKSALEDVRHHPRFFNRREREQLSGVPGYFHTICSGH